MKNRGPWFPLPTEILNEEAIQTMDDHRFRQWFELLAMTAEQNGVLPDLSAIASRFGMTKVQAAHLVADLLSRKALEKRFGVLHKEAKRHVGSV